VSKVPENAKLTAVAPPSSPKDEPEQGSAPAEEGGAHGGAAKPFNRIRRFFTSPGS
jgi:hypothetical protein